MSAARRAVLPVPQLRRHHMPGTPAVRLRRQVWRHHTPALAVSSTAMMRRAIVPVHEASDVRRPLLPILKYLPSCNGTGAGFIRGSTQRQRRRRPDPFASPPCRRLRSDPDRARHDGGHCRSCHCGVAQRGASAAATGILQFARVNFYSKYTAKVAENLAANPATFDERALTKFCEAIAVFDSEALVPVVQGNFLKVFVCVCV